MKRKQCNLTTKVIETLLSCETIHKGTIYKPMDFDKWHRYKRLTSIYRVCHCTCVCVVLLSDWHIWCMSWVWIITPCLIINKNFIYFLAYIQWLDRPKLKLKLKTKPFHSQTNVKKKHIFTTTLWLYIYIYISNKQGV